MFKGSCCCGAVRFEIDEKPKMVGACHCSRCRKVGGTPFALVETRHFRLLAGRDEISVYQPEPGFKYARSFCGRCGTSLGEMLADVEMFPIPVDCFDDDLGMEIRFHEHVASKPAWFVIPDGVKQFEGDPS